MIVCRDVQDLALPWGKPIGFVPTMGAFHEGHLELMREAKRKCGFCVVSLFVNPTQFGPTEDYSWYPRHEERDIAMAASVGVDVLFAPTVDQMYPRTSGTEITVTGVSARWEGVHRPGHFNGVATIVAKLFNVVRPSEALFGLKDFQQCAVVSQMVEDLRFPLTLTFLETVRESDGLAMSSRNAMLDPASRAIAPLLHRVLQESAAAIRGGSLVPEVLDRGARELGAYEFQVQYFAYVDGITLEPLTEFVAGARLISAARLGSVRLIDNVAV